MAHSSKSLAYICFEVIKSEDTPMCRLLGGVPFTTDDVIRRIHRRNVEAVNRLVESHRDIIAKGIYPSDEDIENHMVKYCEDHGIEMASEEANHERSAYIERHQKRYDESYNFFYTHCDCFDEYDQPCVRKSTAADIPRYIDHDILFIPQNNGSMPFPTTENGELDPSCYDAELVTRDYYNLGREFYIFPLVLIARE